MDKLEYKPTTELMSLQKELEMDHENVKQKILKEYDEMVRIEKEYAKIKEIINSRTR